MRPGLRDSVTPSDEARPKLGWQTDAKTKPQMLLRSKELIRDRIGQLHDLVSLKEHAAMQKMPNGRVETKHGHDDTVMARAMAVCIAQDMAYEEEPVDKESSSMLEHVRDYERALLESASVDDGGADDPEAFLKFTEVA
jgi:hypothetical protein